LRWDEALARYVQARGTGDVEVASYPSHEVLARLEGPPGITWEEALFSRDGRFLAVRFVGATGVVRVWEIASKQLVLQTQDEPRESL
jgi:hypothetical protein